MANSKTVLLLSLATFCAADSPTQTGYGTPDSGYGTPDTGYGSPTGSSGYGSQTGYGYSGQGGYETASGGGDILEKIGENLPLFIATFAAVIAAQFLSPVIGLIKGLIPNPIELKAPLINSVLGIFGLQLCTTAAPPVAFPPGRSFSGRDFKDVSPFQFDISNDRIDIIAGMVENAVNSLSGSYDPVRQ